MQTTQNREALILGMELDLDLWQKLYYKTQKESFRRRLRAIKYL